MSTMRQKPSKKELKEFIEVYEEARKDSGKAAISLSDAINASNKKNENVGKTQFEDFKKLIDIVVNREKSNYISEKSEITINEFNTIYRKAYNTVYDLFANWEVKSSANTLKNYMKNNKIRKSKIFGGFFNMNFKDFSKTKEHFGDWLPLYVLLGFPLIAAAIFLPSIFLAPFVIYISYILYFNISHRISLSRKYKNKNFAEDIGRMIQEDPAFGNTLISVGRKKNMDERIVENLYEEFEKMKSQK